MLLLLGDAHKDHDITTRIFAAQVVGNTVLAILLLELHTGNALVANEGLYAFDEIICDAPQEGW